MEEMVHDALYVSCLFLAVALGVAALVSLFTSLFLSAFQIQDPIIPFVFRAIACFGTLFVFRDWMFGLLESFWVRSLLKLNTIW